MNWVTRENARVDRIACPWLISRFTGYAAARDALRPRLEALLERIAGGR